MEHTPKIDHFDVHSQHKTQEINAIASSPAIGYHTIGKHRMFAWHALLGIDYHGHHCSLLNSPSHHSDRRDHLVLDSASAHRLLGVEGSTAITQTGDQHE